MAIKTLIVVDDMRAQTDNVQKNLVGIADKVNELVVNVNELRGIVTTLTETMLLLNRRVDLGLFATMDEKAKPAVGPEAVGVFDSGEGLEGKVPGDAAEEASLISAAVDATFDAPCADDGGWDPSGVVDDDGDGTDKGSR